MTYVGGNLPETGGAHGRLRYMMAVSGGAAGGREAAGIRWWSARPWRRALRAGGWNASESGVQSGGSVGGWLGGEAVGYTSGMEGLVVWAWKTGRDGWNRDSLVMLDQSLSYHRRLAKGACPPAFALRARSPARRLLAPVVAPPTACRILYFAVPGSVPGVPPYLPTTYQYWGSSGHQPSASPASARERPQAAARRPSPIDSPGGARR